MEFKNLILVIKINCGHVNNILGKILERKHNDVEVEQGVKLIGGDKNFRLVKKFGRVKNELWRRVKKIGWVKKIGRVKNELWRGEKFLGG